MERVCFLFGQQDAPRGLTRDIENAIHDHYLRYGVRTLILGSRGAFDHMAVDAAIAAKKQHKDLTLMLLIPYHPAIRPVLAPLDFDGTFYPPGMETVPPQYAIAHANRYMARTCDTAICAVGSGAIHTRPLLATVRRREIPVANLLDIKTW